MVLNRSVLEPTVELPALRERMHQLEGVPAHLLDLIVAVAVAG